MLKLNCFISVEVGIQFFEVFNQETGEEETRVCITGYQYNSDGSTLHNCWPIEPDGQFGASYKCCGEDNCAPLEGFLDGSVTPRILTFSVAGPECEGCFMTETWTLTEVE